MRICLIKQRSLPVLAEDYKHERIGGEEVQQALLAHALRHAGFDVRLVVGDFGQPDSAVYDGITTHKTFKPDAGLPVIRFIYPRWIKTWQALARADADVYYASCAGMEVGLVAMFCRQHGRRFVFRTAIDTDCEPDRLQVRYRRDKWLYEYGLRRADAVLVQTETQRKRLLLNYGITSSVAGMFVEQPAVDHGAGRDIDVLWVANLRVAKQPERLLEVARRMPDIVFHMAGGAFPGEEPLFEQLATEAKAIPNLTFHGAVPYRDIARLFDRTKLFANTSQTEGFPNTFLQAWSRGLPVITWFDPDGIVACLGLGATTISVEQMVKTLHVYLTDSTTYEASSTAARRFAHQHFGEATVLAPYLQAFVPASVSNGGDHVS